MLGFLGRLFRQNKAEAVLLNLALEMAQHRGADSGKPLEPRLRERYPWLSERQLAGVAPAVQTARRLGHDFAVQFKRDNGRVPTAAEFRRSFGQQCNWVDSKNMRQLYTQTCKSIAK